MMPTQSTGAGAFATFDLARVPSPCFVIDEVRLEANLHILADVAQASGAKILLALKAFSMWSLAPLVSRTLHGTCASGLWEARLARAHYGGHISTYAPAYKMSEIEEIASLSDHLIFNTLAQTERFASHTRTKEIGLRLNPNHSEVAVQKYDPCAPHSRLGQSLAHIPAQLPAQVRGLHLHSLCECDFPPLARTLATIQPFLQAHKSQFDWLNLGGGHLITHPDYQRADLVACLATLRTALAADIYLELGTAVAFDAGILVGEVLDVVEDDKDYSAILDVSATCHMPDVLEAPYRPALLGEQDAQGQTVAVRLGGPSCLAGDVIGTYHFATPPAIGTRLAFLDQAHYSMVKTTTFNGVALPAIAIWNSKTDALRIVRQFGDDEFVRRLS